MISRVFIAVAFFAIITALFKMAAGTLSIKKLNLISITYYIYAVMVYIGAALAYCGLVNSHYLIAKLTPECVDITYLATTCSGLGLALIFLICNFFSGPEKTKIACTGYYQAKAKLGISDDIIFQYVVACLVVAFLCTCYSFAVLGGLPIIQSLLPESESAASIRWSASHAFAGNTYIRNIGMIMLTPLCNFMAFAGWRITRQSRWGYLFAVSSILTVLVLTWNLEKAPLVVHVLFLYVLACLLGFRPSNKQVAFIFAGAGALLLLGYVLTSGSTGPLSLTAGPLSRLVTTPTGTLGLHFMYFPDVHAFLDGRSIPAYWAALFGIPESSVRSGAVVMAIANPAGVANNLAGVMNAFFIGEAYANWGVAGVVVSVIVVGVVMGICHNYVIRHEKTYTSVMFYMVLIKFHFSTMMGGFVDYLSVASLIPFIVIVLPALLVKMGNRKSGIQAAH